MKVQGVGRVPKFVGGLDSFYFCDLGAHAKLGNPKQFCIYPPKYVIVRGLGGIPDFFFDWNPNIYVTQEPMQKFGTLRQPFWDFRNGGKSEKKEKFPLTLMGSGRARLYFCNENSGLPKLLCWSNALRSDQFVMKIVAYLSCFAGRTHFAWTKKIDT